MYWRESANLAEKLGWRVLNPNLPGFAGSDPLPWQRVTIGEISDQVIRLLDNLGVERAVLLGHSMGGAVAVRIADSHPDRVLGIIYRDGAATPEWKNRHGAIVAMLSPLLPGPRTWSTSRSRSSSTLRTCSSADGSRRRCEDSGPTRSRTCSVLRQDHARRLDAHEPRHARRSCAPAARTASRSSRNGAASTAS